MIDYFSLIYTVLWASQSFSSLKEKQTNQNCFPTVSQNFLHPHCSISTQSKTSASLIFRNYWFESETFSKGLYEMTFKQSTNWNQWGKNKGQKRTWNLRGYTAGAAEESEGGVGVDVTKIYCTYVWNSPKTNICSLKEQCKYCYKDTSCFQIVLLTSWNFVALFYLIFKFHTTWIAPHWILW